MTIPSTTSYPQSIDTDTTLFLVHDALRLKLVKDYNPGDVSITVEENADIMEKFPSTGVITLTEQCSDPEERAISFFYNSKTDTAFTGLELLPGFNDVVKYKNITNVTLNVIAKHHNHLKDALIAIQEFVGVQGTIDKTPGGGTLEGRTNFIRKLALTPKAWFEADQTVGLAPLCVNFEDQSFCIKDTDVVYTWDFGDQTTDVSTISVPSSATYPTICVTSAVPFDTTNVIVRDVDGGSIRKCYSKPGNYDVKLTVKNQYGEDTVEFLNMINVRAEAPDEAVIDFIPAGGQNTTSGSPDGGPFTTPPKIRSVTGKNVNVSISSGENPSTPGISYAGEHLDSDGRAIDPIVEYTWIFNDDTTHANLPSAAAIYSVGGLYDMKLRVDTELGAYRITTYEDSIDIIEDKNLWLWIKTGNTIRAHEFGLISETFKTSNNSFTISQNSNFLTGTNNEEQAKQEFGRNVGFAPRSTSGSGDGSTTMLYWAGGSDNESTLASQKIKVIEYQGFSDTYTNHTEISNRPWNWLVLSSSSKSYFIFGQNPTHTANTNPSYQVKTSYDLLSLTSSNDTLTSGFYKNGADELTQHVSAYDSGDATNGYFAVYRTTWKDQSGYVVRNDGVGAFYRLKSFYKTDGTVANPFASITKLNDMSGTTKLEGQLVSLTNGIFFFNNSGNISAFNDINGVWETGGSTVPFRSVQDTTVTDFDSLSNPLLAVSDGDRTAYLSYDYSSSAFTKFNGTDLTISNIGSRPVGTQFLMGIY